MIEIFMEGGFGGGAYSIQSRLQDDEGKQVLKNIVRKLLCSYYLWCPEGIMQPVTEGGVMLSRLSILIIIILTGCTTAYQHRFMAQGEVIPEGEAMVFGGISLNKTIEEYGGKLSIDTGSLVFINSDTAQTVAVYGLPELGGDYYLHFPPGNYAIYQLVMYFSPLLGHSYSVTHRVYAEFSIEKPGEVIYLGILKIDLEHGYIDKTIVDDLAVAEAKLSEKFPDLTRMPIKRLLKLEVEK